MADSRNSASVQRRPKKLLPAGGGTPSRKLSPGSHEAATRHASTDSSSLSSSLRQQWKEDLDKIVNLIDSKIASASQVLPENSSNREADSLPQVNLLRAIKSDLMSEISKLNCKWQECFDRLELKIDKNTALIDKLSLELDALQQYSRRPCLLIHGIDETAAENTTEKSLDLLNKRLNLSLNPKDIVTSHRIGSTRQRNHAEKKARPIIVKFVRMSDRDIVYKNKKMLKGTKFIITENLTKARKKVMNDMALLKIRCWSWNGEIFAINKLGDKICVTQGFNQEDFIPTNPPR